MGSIRPRGDQRVRDEDPQREGLGEGRAGSAAALAPSDSGIFRKSDPPCETRIQLPMKTTDNPDQRELNFTHLVYGQQARRDPVSQLWVAAADGAVTVQQGPFILISFQDGHVWLQHPNHPGSVLRQTPEGYFHNDKELSIQTMTTSISEGIRILTAHAKKKKEAGAAAVVVDADNLIPIDRQPGTRFPVNARDLHGFLGVGRDFSTWMRDRIIKFKLVKGVEYTVFPKSGENPQGGRPTQDYLLTITAARWLAADVNSERGRQMIKFLVDVMEKAEQQAPAFRLPQTYAEALRQLADSEEQKARLEVTLQEEERRVKRLALACAEVGQVNTSLVHTMGEMDKSVLLTDWLKQTKNVHGHGAINGRKILAFKGLLNRAIVGGCRHTSEAVINDWALSSGILIYKRDLSAAGVHKGRKPTLDDPRPHVYDAQGAPVMIYPLVVAVTPEKGTQYLMDLFMQTPECTLRRLVAASQGKKALIKRLEGRFSFMQGDSSWEKILTPEEVFKVVKMRKEPDGKWTVWCNVAQGKWKHRAVGHGSSLELALFDLADKYYIGR